MARRKMATGTPVTYEAPNWNDLYTMLLNQAKQIRDSGFQPDVIVGICRGGWIPARILSDLLGNPNLASVKAENYVGVGKTKKQPTLTQPVSAEVADKAVLLVDDVADTGQSLQLVATHLKKQGACEVKIAILYYKPLSSLKPDFYQKETLHWVVFPWELYEVVQEVAGKADELAALVAAGVPKQILAQLQKVVETEKC
jgi:hypoxanthine phosphoribosyltransferase